MILEFAMLFAFIQFIFILIFQEMSGPYGNEGMANPEEGDDRTVHKQFQSTYVYTPNNFVWTLRFDMFEAASRLLNFTDVLVTQPDFMKGTANIDAAHFPLAYEMGQIIDLGPAYDFSSATGHPEMSFFQWFAGLEENERHNLANAGWKTRKIQFGEQYIISGYAFAGILVGAFALAVLKSKVRTVYGQVNPTNDRMVLFKQNLPATFKPSVYRGLYAGGNLTDDQLRNYLRSILELINDNSWYLPRECFEICDKIVGHYKFKLPLPPELKLDLEQDHDFLMLSVTSSAGPTFTGTVADDNILAVMDSLTYFYSELQRISQLAEYNSQFAQAGLFSGFLTKYSPVSVDYKFLTSWPEIKVPFFVPFLRTNYYTPNLRYQLQNDDRYAATFGDGTHNWLFALENHSIEANISNFYLRVRIMPGMSEEEMKELLTVGHYFFGGLFSDNFAFDSNTQMSQTEQVWMGCMMERQFFNDKGELLSREAVSNVEANSFYNINELPTNVFLTIWNKTEYDPYRNLFLVRIDDVGTTPINSTYIYAPQLPAITNNSELTVVQVNHDLKLDEAFGVMNFELKNVYVKWSKDFMLRFYNPTIAPPQKREPDAKSGLTPATFADVKDPSKLKAFISDLEAQAKYHKEEGNNDQADNRIKLISDVKKLITKLEEENQSPPPGAKPDGQSSENNIPPEGSQNNPA